jgi:hypothetical protein
VLSFRALLAVSQHLVRGVEEGPVELWGLGSHIDLGDLFGLVTAPGTDFFVVKTSFWLPIR